MPRPVVSLASEGEKHSMLGSASLGRHAQSCLSLCRLLDCSPQAPLSMGFPRQEYWRRLPFPSPGVLPDPGIEPGSPVSPALAGGFPTTEP